MTSINDIREREPDGAPFDPSEYDWYLSEWRESGPSAFSRDPETGDVREFSRTRPRPLVTVTVDTGNCVRKYVLIEKRGGGPVAITKA